MAHTTSDIFHATAVFEFVFVLVFIFVFVYLKILTCIICDVFDTTIALHLTTTVVSHPENSKDSSSKFNSLSIRI